MKLLDIYGVTYSNLSAYLLKEEFQLKKEAQTIRRHKDHILNWFRAKKSFNSGIVQDSRVFLFLTIMNKFL